MRIEPWSCCKLNYPAQCFHDPIQQIFESEIIGSQTESALESINKNGCIENMKQPLETGFLLFIITAYITFFIQVCLYFIYNIELLLLKYR